MSEPEHEKLVVYAKALALAVVLDKIALAAPERRGDLRDQLRCASASIVLNIAEGAGEFSPADKARFYRMARRSSTESMAVLDLLHAMSAGTIDVAGAKRALGDVNAMLTGLAKALEKR